MVTSKCSFCQRQHAFSTCAAYGAWREAYGVYPWPLVRRVKNVWDRIRIWLTGNFPEVLPTLCKGASEVELNELEKSLKVKLPLPTRVLYRFSDGQKVCSNVSSERSEIYTRDVTRLREFTRPKYIVTKVSAYNENMFFLDCELGQLHVGTKNLLIKRRNDAMCTKWIDNFGA
ncbi:hypothetical protein Hanom_Chr09g00855181 [Helianthus anomalus]